LEIATDVISRQNVVILYSVLWVH